MAKQVLKPWKDVCILRDEIKTKTLTMADFAVDLHRVIFQPGSGKHYTDPEAFFATTYATPNLRRFCRDVLRRLAGEDGGEPIINVAQTFGGGKSHTLTALYYLTTLGKKLPTKATAVQHISGGSEAGESAGSRGGGGVVRQGGLEEGRRSKVAGRQGAVVPNAVELDRVATARREGTGNHRARRKRGGL